MQHNLSKMLFEYKDPAKDLVADIAELRSVLKEQNRYTNQEIDHLLETKKLEEIAPILASMGAAVGKVAGAAANTGIKVAASAGQATAKAVSTGSRVASQTIVKAAKKKALNVVSDIISPDIENDSGEIEDIDDQSDIDQVDDHVLESLLTFELKNSIFINEDNTALSQQDDSNDSDESNDSKKEEEDNSIEAGSDLDSNDLISNTSIKHSDLQNKVVPEILRKIKSSSKIQTMIEKFNEINQDNPTEEDEKFIEEYIEEISKGNSGDGLVDIQLLKKLFSTPFTVTTLGKTILNPMQMKKGTDQKAGVTAADIDVYKKLKMIPFFAMTKEGNDISTVSGHKGKDNYYIVFVCPAFGAVIENTTELNNYKKIFPEFCEEVNLSLGDTILDSDTLKFVYVDGDKELEQLQNNFIAVFSKLSKLPIKSDGQESEPSEQDEAESQDGQDQVKSQESSEAQKQQESVNEIFIYRQGLSFLLSEENQKFPTKKFVDIVNDDAESDDMYAKQVRSFDSSQIIEESRAITFQAYKRFVKIASEQLKDDREKESKDKTDITQSFIDSTSDTAQSLMGGYLGFMAAGALTGVVGLSTAGAGLAVLPYILGAKMATPGLSKGISGTYRGITKLINHNKNKKFEKKELNDQIKEALEFYLQQGEEVDSGTKSSKLDFVDVASEAEKLNRSFLHVFNKTIKDDKEDEKRTENVLITHSDFETACNRENYQLTKINDIPQSVYQDFMIDCNDLLRQSKIEIKGISEFSSKRKMGDGFYHEADFGEQPPAEMDKSQRLGLFREVINMIPEDSDRTRIIKAAILVKLDSGDEDAANELFSKIIEDPETFTKGVEKALSEDTSDDEALQQASDVTGSSTEDIKKKQQSLSTFFITTEEIEILKNLDTSISKIFGASVEDLNTSTNSFKLEASGMYKIVEYKKREDLSDEYKDIKNLSRPNTTSIRDSFSFPEMIANKINNTSTMKKLVPFLFHIVYNVIYAGDRFGRNETIDCIDQIKDLTDKEDVKQKFGLIFDYITKENLYDKMKEFQAESEMLKESKYFNRSLSSLLFENNLNNVSFR